MFLKVSPIQRALRFGQKLGKLSPCYIGPFKILECVGNVSYRLALSPRMSRVYVFYVSILSKYIHDATYVIDFNDIEVNGNSTYYERPVQILDFGSRELRNKEIPLVKVRLNYHNVEEASWELEYEICEKYLKLFNTS